MAREHSSQCRLECKLWGACVERRWRHEEGSEEAVGQPSWARIGFQSGCLLLVHLGHVGLHGGDTGQEAEVRTKVGQRQAILVCNSAAHAFEQPVEEFPSRAGERRVDSRPVPLHRQ